MAPQRPTAPEPVERIVAPATRAPVESLVVEITIPGTYRIRQKEANGKVVWVIERVR